MATYPALPLPSYEYHESDGYKVAVTKYPNGTEQRIAQRSQKLREITLTYVGLPEADVDILNSFFNSMGGPLTSFNFVSFKDGVSTVVRYDEDSLNIVMTEFESYTVSVVLIEVKNETPAA